MPSHTSNATLLLDRRDILRFIQVRDSVPTDDLELGGLLLKSFTVTNRTKSPSFKTNDDRILELLDVAGRRDSGAVRLLEFGKKIVGTYSLMRPHAPQNLATHPQFAHLRCVAIDPEFHGMGLSQRLMQDALENAQRINVPGIVLEIYRGSVRLAHFYERYGFKRFPDGDYCRDSHSFDAYFFGF